MQKVVLLSISYCAVAEWCINMTVRLAGLDL